MSDIVTILKVYERYILYGGVSAIVFSLYMFINDVVRIVKFIAYKFGYNRGSGKGVIPGPSNDTRVTRFTSGSKIIPKYRLKYGSIYRVFCGSIPEVVISTPEDVMLYYQGDAKLHSKEENIGFGEYMGKFLGHAVGSKAGDDWARMRTVIDPHFSVDDSIELLPIVISDTEEWLQKLPKSSVASLDKANRVTVKAEQLVSELPFMMIARRLFGDLIDEEFTAELCGMIGIHERIIGHTFFSKLLQYKVFHYLPIQANRDLEKFSKQWAELLLRKSLECEQRGIKTAVSDLYKSVKAGDLSFVEFAHTIDEILFTNIDVTTTSISWAVCQVALYPEIQARLLEELRNALKDESLGATHDERRAAYIRKTNTLLHYSYLEAARLKPILFYTIPEITHDPKVIQGYYIPPKSSILIDAYTLNRTAPVWGNDGDTFRPDRFDGLPATQYRYSFWRFGIGPRKCVGQHFGDKMVKVILAAILERYHMEMKDNYLGPNPQMFLHAPKGVLILTPRDEKV